MKTLAECILKIRELDAEIAHVDQQLVEKGSAETNFWSQLSRLNHQRQKTVEKLAAEVLKNFTEISDDELRSIMELPITSVGIRIFQDIEPPRTDVENPDAEERLYSCVCGRLVKHLCAYCERCSVCGEGLSLDEHKEWACKLCLQRTEEINDHN